MSAHTGFTIRALIFSGAMAFAVPAGAVDPGDPQAGEQIARTWCASCHTVAEDQAVASPDVPTFASLAKRPDVSPDGLATFLVAPHPPMPDMNLSREEIADVVAYILSLGKN